MGDAKRRKQLGLMPTVHSFEAELDEGGTVTLLRGPEDLGLRKLIVGALMDSQTTGAAWASEYRTSLLLSGKYGATLTTAADVEAMPVPPLRRISGELALGPVGVHSEQVSIPVEGGAVRLRGQQHSTDGTRWDTLSAPRDPQQIMSALRDNPAFTLEGEVIGQFVAEHWQAGRIDIDPDPPEELLEALENVILEWHGETETLWAKIHRDRLEDDDAPIPLARRSAFEVRRPAPLQNPLSGVFAIRAGVEFIPTMDSDAYSLDGETWISYADPDAEVDGSHLPAGLAEIFDMEMVGATVYADGRVEFGDDVASEYLERIQTELRETTGAGDADAWAEWTRHLLSETYAEELAIPAGQSLPVPVAVRLDIPEDALEDPDPLAQTFMESEVTFDGQTWRDLFGDGLPPELAAFAAPSTDEDSAERLN